MAKPMSNEVRFGIALNEFKVAVADLEKQKAEQVHAAYLEGIEYGTMKHTENIFAVLGKMGWGNKRLNRFLEMVRDEVQLQTLNGSGTNGEG